MGIIYDALIRHCDEADLKYQRDDSSESIRMHIAASNGRWEVTGRVKQERGTLIIYSVLPCNCPKESISEIALFLSRANYGLIIGNFEVDLNDGEIRYKTSAWIGNQYPGEDFIRHLMGFNISTMDKYLPGLMKVCFGNVSGKEAIDMIEGNNDESLEEGTGDSDCIWDLNIRPDEETDPDLQPT